MWKLNRIGKEQIWYEEDEHLAKVNEIEALKQQLETVKEMITELSFAYPECACTTQQIIEQIEKEEDENRRRNTGST